MLMAIDIVLGFLFIGGLAALIVLVVRKIPILRITNPAEVSKFGQQQVRQQLVANHLKRQLAGLMKRTAAVFTQSTQVVKTKKASLSGRFDEWEEKLKRTLSERTSPQRTIEDYMAQAQAALQQENYTAAEQAYLEVLRLNEHQLPAYQGLGEVYLEQRDFEAAREVYEFLLKRGRAASSSLGLARVASGQGRLEEARDEYLGALQLTTSAQPRLELAQILRELGDFTRALKYLKEAKKIEPQNPKILDFYIEVSILNGQLNQAEEGLESLRQANPDNQKIAEFAREIRDLEQKQKPKTKRTVRSGNGSTSFGLPTGKR